MDTRGCVRSADCAARGGGGSVGEATTEVQEIDAYAACRSEVVDRLYNTDIASE